MREGKVVVLGVGRYRADASWIKWCSLLVQHLHVADVVDECDLFQHDDQSFPIHLDSHDHSVECQLAYCRVFLCSLGWLLDECLLYPSSVLLPHLRVDYP